MPTCSVMVGRSIKAVLVLLAAAVPFFIVHAKNEAVLKEFKEQIAQSSDACRTWPQGEEIFYHPPKK